jgi:hypothetical protein
MGARRPGINMAGPSEAERQAEERAAREKSLEEDRLRREEDARRRGLRGSQALVGPGGMMGFGQGSLSGLGA